MSTYHLAAIASRDPVLFALILSDLSILYLMWRIWRIERTIGTDKGGPFQYHK